LHSLYHVNMTIELSDKQKIKLLNSDDVYTVMQGILLREEKIDQEKEHFWMIGLANNNRILYIELVSLGSVNAVTVEPMNVFRVAVLKGAVKAIIAHNHPSGELKPSDADKDLTDRLIQVGRILNIPVIDHLIISVNSYLSFVDTGLFEQLEDSTKWVPAFELIERIKKEEKKIRDQAVQEEKEKTIKKVVKNARRKGLSVDDIAELTGLTPEEIAKIK
jgi:DNA repair protein RadC